MGHPNQKHQFQEMSLLGRSYLELDTLSGKSALTKHNLALAYNAGDMIIHGTANDSKVSASPAASSTILFTPAMIILSATGDQTQIVLRSADMSRPVTFTLYFQSNRLEIVVSCCSDASLALLTV